MPTRHVSSSQDSMLSVKKRGLFPSYSVRTLRPARWFRALNGSREIRCLHTPDRCIQHLTCYNALTYSILLQGVGTFVLKLTEGIRSISEIEFGV